MFIGFEVKLLTRISCQYTYQHVINLRNPSYVSVSATGERRVILMCRITRETAIPEDTVRQNIFHLVLNNLSNPFCQNNPTRLNSHCHRFHDAITIFSVLSRFSEGQGAI